jgi:hypothetical protein
VNVRPRSEEPFGLADSRPGWVSAKGFRWVSGRCGPTVAQTRTGLFLVPNSRTGRIVIPPADLYLEFAKLPIDEPSTLEFANRFGALGLRREHFHSDPPAGTLAESARAWGSAIGRFQLYFELWQVAEERNRAALRKALIEVGALLDDERFGSALTRDLVKTAKSYLVREINIHLNPPTGIPAGFQTCFQGCDLRTRAVRIPEHISWQLSLTDSRGRISIQPRLIPDRLVATIWLQFANLVCGQRVIRQCEVCGGWMDISENVRKGSKRMHETCSLRRRMQKWRAGKRAAPSHPERSDVKEF